MKIIMKLIRLVLGNLIVFLNFIFRPKKVKRSVEDQAQVNKSSSDLSLYEFRLCPFCVKVRRKMYALNLPIAINDAKKDPFRQELLDGGGKVKVPCLRISEGDSVKWMYESSDINKYLMDRFN